MHIHRPSLLEEVRRLSKASEKAWYDRLEKSFSINKAENIYDRIVLYIHQVTLDCSLNICGINDNDDPLTDLPDTWKENGSNFTRYILNYKYKNTDAGITLIIFPVSRYTIFIQALPSLSSNDKFRYKLKLEEWLDTPENEKCASGFSLLVPFSIALKNKVIINAVREACYYRGIQCHFDICNLNDFILEKIIDHADADDILKISTVCLKFNKLIQSRPKLHRKYLNAKVSTRFGIIYHRNFDWYLNGNYN
ncbi:hypothetical protein GJ496_002310 [Pomphorhynchus laevis]|nr:hypothetical protein GJ496_002310 [Pomphorhynchus laevis]